MPTYDYVCRDCGHPFEIRLSMSAYAEGVSPPCPACGAENAVRSFSAVNVLTGSRASGAATLRGTSGCGSGGFT